jgi:hypothetical protein
VSVIVGERGLGRFAQRLELRGCGGPVAAVVLVGVRGRQEMVGDLSGRAAVLAQRPGGTAVQFAAPARADPAERRGPCGGMPRLHVLEDAGRLQGAERLACGVRRDAQHPGDALRGREGAEERAGLRHGSGGGPAAVQAGRDGHGVGAAGARSQARRGRVRALFDEGAQQQRIASAQVVERSGETAAAGGPGRVTDLRTGQAPELDTAEVGPPHEFGDERGAARLGVECDGDHDHDAGRTDVPRQVLEVVQRCVVRVLDIVDADHHGCVRAQLAQPRAEVLHVLGT